MINLAVIDLKDIVKYLLKITIIILLAVGLTKFFSSFKTKLDTEKNSLLSCMDVVLPCISKINNTDDDTSDDNTKQVKTALQTELGMIAALKDDEEEDTDSEDLAESEEDEEETNDETVIEEAETGLETSVIETNVPEKYTTEYNGVKIKNETDDIELTEDMLEPDVDVNTEDVLIYHTHSSESYTSTEKYSYTATGNFRTTDINYNVVRVGTELTNYLEYYGYNVIHDTTIYDKSYSKSYSRSLKGVSAILEENEDIDILFDIHRDAISDSTYAPTVQIGDEEAAQLMFVIGTNGGGSEHDNWNENLKLAIKIQEKANELYPGLFKPIILRDSRYNQHLAVGASIIEVGATGNTLEQCLTSMKYLAKVLSEVLK